MVGFGFWYYKDMARLLGVNVKKRKSFIIFVNFIRWNFTRDDFGEDTVGHYLRMELAI